MLHLIPKQFPPEGGSPSRPDDAMGHAAYLSAFGFHHDPFPVAPDDEHFFLPKRIEILITEILHSLFVRKGFVCLTGEIGLGKTTISRRILRELDDHGVETALVFNTFLQEEALLEAVARDFGLDPPRDDLHALMDGLNRFFLEKFENGINCAILIDDAQELSIESLEMIRLISNLEHNARKLVQILLVGQPELREKLANPRLRQLASRVVLHGRIESFNREETAQYVHYKLATAGCGGCLDVPSPAIRTLHRLSRGNPRRINILMDRCLYLAFASDRHRITPAMLRTVAREVDPIPTANPDASIPFWQRHLPGLLSGALLSALAMAGVIHYTPPYAMVAAPSTLSAPLAAPSPPVTAPPPPAAMEKPAPVEAPPVVVEEKPAPVEAPRLASGGESASAPPIAEPPPPSPTAATSAPDAAMPEAITRFLAAHGLESHGQAFMAAWRGRDWEAFSRLIQEKTGLMLIHLREIPTEARRSHAALRLVDGSYLLFWRPDLKPESMEYGARGEGIRTVQERLSHIGMYGLPVDGIVGWGMRQALTRFQRAHGLPLSGEATPETLFLLSLQQAPVPAEESAP